MDFYIYIHPINFTHGEKCSFRFGDDQMRSKFQTATRYEDAQPQSIMQAAITGAKQSAHSEQACVLNRDCTSTH